MKKIIFIALIAVSLVTSIGAQTIISGSFATAAGFDAESSQSAELFGPGPSDLQPRIERGLPPAPNEPME